MKIDFEGLQRRLEDARENTDGSDTQIRTENVLRRRARDMADRRLHAEEREVLVDAVVVRREDGLFALPMTAAQEVRLVTVAHLPGAGAIVNGLFQIRGRTHALVDLAPLFGNAEVIGHGKKTLAVLLSGKPGELGVRIDEVLGSRTIYADEIDEGLQERELGFVSHVTRDLVQIVDVGALLESPAVRIGERRELRMRGRQEC